MSSPSFQGSGRRTALLLRLVLLPTRVLLPTLALLAAAFLPVAAARADGDPASDVLLAQSAFYPYQPAVSAKLESTLNAVLQSATRSGLDLKVAIIGSPQDLGADPRFFGYPQQYAHYLDREISFNHTQPLLVVMPAGFATIAAGPPGALAGLNVEHGHASYGLTVSAIHAVVTLVRATGHALAMPAIPADSSAGGAGNIKTVLVFAIPSLLLIAAGIATLRSGAATTKEQPPGSTPA